MHTNEKKNKV